MAAIPRAMFSSRRWRWPSSSCSSSPRPSIRKYRDTYREKVLELIESKRQGAALPEQQQHRRLAPVIDLMDALKKSLAAQPGNASSRLQPQPGPLKRRTVGLRAPKKAPQRSRKQPRRAAAFLPEGGKGELKLLF